MTNANTATIRTSDIDALADALQARGFLYCDPARGVEYHMVAGDDSTEVFMTGAGIVTVKSVSVEEMSAIRRAARQA